MKFMSRKNAKLLVLFVLLITLVGCTRTTGADGKTLPEKIIYLTTTWKEIFANESWFTAIFTYPIAQVINMLSPKIGVVAAILLTTVLVNLIILPLSIKSTAGSQKMQMIQPEMQKIQAKYEGRTDDMSQQRMAMEMQQLYNKYGINPIASLVTTFIQFPLLIGMYNAVRRSQAVANATFMGTNLALSPKQAIPEKAWICVAIFLITFVCQFVSMKVPQWIAEKRGKEEAEKHHKTYKKPENQNQMMMYSMLAMIALAMYSIPTAVSLYYGISSLVNIAKTLVIDKLTHKEA